MDALRLVAPATLVGPLCRGVAADGMAERSTVPGEGTVRRGEFGVDAAISYLRRKYYSSSVLRYVWSDSSPQCGYDWLWSQCTEIERSELVSTCRAGHELTFRIKEHADKLQAEQVAHPTPNLSDTFHEPLDSWTPLCTQLSRNLREYTYTPTALAAGFRGLVHKLAAFAHMLHIDVPSYVPLREVTDSIVSHTSDLGIEASMPDFRLASGDLESLLPDWNTRGELKHEDWSANKAGTGGIVYRADATPLPFWTNGQAFDECLTRF